jgi:hypothetical protein
VKGESRALWVDSYNMLKRHDCVQLSSFFIRLNQIAVKRTTEIVSALSTLPTATIQYANRKRSISKDTDSGDSAGSFKSPNKRSRNKKNEGRDASKGASDRSEKSAGFSAQEAGNQGNMVVQESPEENDNAMSPHVSLPPNIPIITTVTLSPKGTLSIDSSPAKIFSSPIRPATAETGITANTALDDTEWIKEDIDVASGNAEDEVCFIYLQFADGKDMFDIEDRPVMTNKESWMAKFLTDQTPSDSLDKEEQVIVVLNCYVY